MPPALIAERLAVSRQTLARDRRELETRYADCLRLIDLQNAQAGLHWTPPPAR